MTETSSAEKPRGLFAKFGEASGFTKTVLILGGVTALFVIALITALLVGIIFGNSEDVAGIVAIVRDLFIILLALQGMVMCLAVMVLILQLAALINLLQNEFNPIVKNLQETASTLKGTTEFLSENLVTPVIESKAWLAGISAFVKGAAKKPKAEKAPAAKKGKGKDEPKTE